MNKLMTVLLLALVSLPAFAGTGADNWDKTKVETRWDECHGFESGYFDFMLNKFVWTDSDRMKILSIFMNIGGTELAGWVSNFYRDPEVGDVPPSRAMRLCLEMLIARSPDGPRLLKVLGVDVASLPNLKAR